MTEPNNLEWLTELLEFIDSQCIGVEKGTGRHGLNYDKAGLAITAKINEMLLQETKRCIDIMQDILMENFHYQVMCGEIKDPTGKIDVNKALVEWQKLEPERKQFAEYVDELLRKRKDEVLGLTSKEIAE